MTITFTPHLLPLAQGELVSCYVTPSRELGDGRARRALRRRVRARAVRRAARRARSACSTCATPTTAGSRGITDPRTGRVIVFAAIDNLWKGAASQAVQNLNLMFGRPETEGLL